MKDETRKLAAEFAVVANKYARAFCEKHGFDFSANDWAAGEVGGMLNVSDMYVNFDDIRTDIDNEFEPDTFAEWYWYDLELCELGCPKKINYRAFAEGAPRPYTEEQLANIRNAHKAVAEAEARLREMLEEGGEA